MPTARPDFGGIWGTGTWGGRQYAAHIQCGAGLRTTRPDCGGIWGAGVWGGRYYAGHVQCFPPMRTTRPDCGGIWGTGAWGMRYYAGHIQCGEVPPIPPVPSGNNGRGNQRWRRKEEDLDDLLFIITCWNALPRQAATPVSSGEVSGPGASN